MRPSLAIAMRRAPLGVSLLAALLSIGGMGLIAAGVIFLFADGEFGLYAAATSIVSGPAILYFSYELIRLARWTWIALAVVIGLLILSSTARLLVAPGMPAAVMFELVLEIGATIYLTRPAIRAAFGWPSAAGE